MVLPVRIRIHWGIGRFCFCALASFCFVRNDLWLWMLGKRSANRPLVLDHVFQIPVPSKAAETRSDVQWYVRLVELLRIFMDLHTGILTD